MKQKLKPEISRIPMKMEDVQLIFAFQKILKYRIHFSPKLHQIILKINFITFVCISNEHIGFLSEILPFPDPFPFLDPSQEIWEIRLLRWTLWKFSSVGHIDRINNTNEKFNYSNP